MSGGSRYRLGIACAAVFAALLALYQTTLAPSVTFIDAGELAAVSTVLGVAHPTGYPLFTLLGRAVVMLPWGPEEIVRLNVFSSLLTALAVGAAVVLAMLLARGFRRSASSPASSLELALVGAGALVLGTSQTVWAQSAAVEVYSLHLFLAVVTLGSFVKGLEEQVRERGRLSRWLVFASFCLGLGFSNHMTTLLLAPALAYLSVSALGVRRASLVRLAPLLPFFGLGLTPYAYLLIRSASRPPLNWGDPSSLESLLWHLGGKQYRSWIFTGFESASKQFSYFIGRLPEEFSPIALALAAVGLVWLWKTERRWFWFLAILFASCVGYAVNYDIHDIDSYFLLAFLVLGLAAALGARTLGLALAARLPGPAKAAPLLACLAVAALQAGANRAAVDQSDDTLVEDYSRAILRSLDSNAVVLSYQWDYFVSPALYFQHVRRERPDVVVIDKELLRRSWYYAQLENNWPWLVARSRPAIEAFLVELRKFERGLPYRFEAIESSFNAMINDLIRASLADRPVYVGPEIEPQFGAGLERVPTGLLFKLEKPGGRHTLAGLESFEFRPNSQGGRLADGLRLQCAKMLVFRAIWLGRDGLYREALEALELARKFGPLVGEIERLQSELRALERASSGALQK